MERISIRLEALKLAHTLARDISEVLGRAKAYEDYLLGVQEEPLKEQEATPARKKKAGNASILD